MNIIAITSCPVGMAHTYMAAKALVKAAKKKGYQVKVETQGSMGVRNELTQNDIENADIFIDSADVAMLNAERFKNVLTLKTSTSLDIKKTDLVLEEALKLVNK